MTKYGTRRFTWFRPKKPCVLGGFHASDISVSVEVSRSLFFVFKKICSVKKTKKRIWVWVSGDDGLFEGCTQNNNLTKNRAKTATVLSNTRTPEDQSTFNPGCGRWNLHIIIWSMVQHSNNIPTLVHCLVFIGSTYSRLIKIKLPICHPLCRGQYACAKHKVDQSMARWSACPWHMCILCRFCSTK